MTSQSHLIPLPSLSLRSDRAKMSDPVEIIKHISERVVLYSKLHGQCIYPSRLGFELTASWLSAGEAHSSATIFFALVGAAWLASYARSFTQMLWDIVRPGVPVRGIQMGLCGELALTRTFGRPLPQQLTIFGAKAGSWAGKRLRSSKGNRIQQQHRC
jgi:hypothetical protein